MKTVSLIAASLLVLTLCLLVIARPSPAFSPAASAGETGARLYAQKCSRCHGRDGRATGLKARSTGSRNLTDPQWQDRVSDERIFNSINNGKGKMPGYGKRLSETEINALVNYVRRLRR